MQSQLLFYQNELKNKQVQSYKLLGIVTELLYSNTLFPQNKDLLPFVTDLFSLSETPDCTSRPLLIGRLIKGMVSQQLTIQTKVLSQFIAEQLQAYEAQENTDKLKKNRKKKDPLGGWID